jgi:hypothetical protein
MVHRSGAGLASPFVVMASQPGATGGPDCTCTTRWVSVRPRRRGCAKVMTSPGRTALARCGLTMIRSPGEYAGRIDPVTMVSGCQSTRRNAPYVSASATTSAVAAQPSTGPARDRRRGTGGAPCRAAQ